MLSKKIFIVPVFFCSTFLGEAFAESKLVKFQQEVADMEEMALVMITAVESAKACLGEKEGTQIP